MFIRKGSEAIRLENSPTCVAYEYGMPTTELGSAVIEISGRYPDEGWALNTDCISLIYVIKGGGLVVGEDSNTSVSEDHQILIERGEKYALTGDMKILFTSSPPWTPEQAKNVQ